MNSTRNFTVESAYQEIKVTPFWLLGFIEAEGSFRVAKNTFQQTFSLELAIIDKPLILAIAQFLKDLIPNELNHLREKDNLIGMFETIRPSDGPAKSSVKMFFSKFDFISLVFSPFLEGLTFFSKKELDFKDRKS